MTTPTDPASADARVGTWLRDKYRLDRVLGEGGMAIVYAATHRNNKRVAVKMLHPFAAARAEIQARFLREGYLANTVDHPGAVAVLDDDVSEDGIAFIVMELLEGTTVEDLAPDGAPRPGLDVTLNIAFQLLDTLSAAHDKGIVHRDIKPANLFVTRSGQLKVLDFGIARLTVAGDPPLPGARPGASAATTQAGVAMGTPAFMGPEQALGKTKEIDARTDLWAVGASMFWLLSGRYVHEGETLQHLMVLAATSPAPPLASVRPDIPGSVAAIVDRALAFDRGGRWPTAAAMRDAVDEAYRALFGQPIVPAMLAPLAAVRAPRIVHADASATSPDGGGIRALDVTVVATRESASGASARAIANDFGSTAVPVSSTPRPTLGRKRPGLVAASVSAAVLAIVAAAWLGLRAPVDAPARAAASVESPPVNNPANEPTTIGASPPATGAPAAPEPERSAAPSSSGTGSATAAQPVFPPGLPPASGAPPAEPRKHVPRGGSGKSPPPPLTRAPADDFDRQ